MSEWTVVVNKKTKKRHIPKKKETDELSDFLCSPQVENLISQGYFFEGLVSNSTNFSEFEDFKVVKINQMDHALFTRQT